MTSRRHGELSRTREIGNDTVDGALNAGAALRSQSIATRLADGARAEQVRDERNRARDVGEEQRGPPAAITAMNLGDLEMRIDRAPP